MTYGSKNRTESKSTIRVQFRNHQADIAWQARELAFIRRIFIAQATSERPAKLEDLLRDQQGNQGTFTLPEPSQWQKIETAFDPSLKCYQSPEGRLSEESVAAILMSTS